MARHTRIKLAALATSLVAALGIVAVAPAVATSSGAAHVTPARDRALCC
jgi:hypothetical protein